MERRADLKQFPHGLPVAITGRVRRSSGKTKFSARSADLSVRLRSDRQRRRALEKLAAHKPVFI
jgi:hypothetical protein